MVQLENNIPIVENFEKYVDEKNFEKATNELLKILKRLEENHGVIEGLHLKVPLQLLNENIEEYKTMYFCTKMANIITKLFIDPEFQISKKEFQNLVLYYRWIVYIFSSSPYINADHILREYNLIKDSKRKYNELILKEEKGILYKFVLMYLPDSSYLISYDALWNIDPIACATLCLIMQTPRFIGSKRGFDKKHEILQWLPKKLDEINNPEDLPTALFHSVYMHCSYDTDSNKHQIKKSLNNLIRKFILQKGWGDTTKYITKNKNGKPILFVLLEYFSSTHSVYRVHAKSLLSAKEHFYIVGVGKSTIDLKGKQIFDEFYEIQGNTILDQLNYVVKICNEVKPAITYMPSIGMSLLAIFFSNVRVAPLQIVGLGHPATTYSKFIDYVVVEEDWIGEESCFSEKLIKLPSGSMPHVPFSSEEKNINYILKENPVVVNIGITTAVMKLNYHFLQSLKEIKNKTKVKVHYIFTIAHSSGILNYTIKRFIQEYLGKDVTINFHSPYDEYLDTLRKCDMMLNPFPFGNANGIVDMITAGLVGICKTGPEVHEHIDEALFKRLELPELLIANTVEEYIEKAVELIENHKKRLEIRKYIIENNKLNKLFSGDSTPMGIQFKKKLMELNKK